MFSNLNVIDKTLKVYRILFFLNCTYIKLDKGELLKMNHELKLSEREIEVLRLIVKGKSNDEIASELIVTIDTVKAHVSSVLIKLCVKNRIQAAIRAIKERLV